MSKLPIGLLFSSLLLCVFAKGAFADQVCLKSVIRNGKIRHATRTVKTGVKCPSGYTSILDSQSPTTSSLLTGPQGPRGETGAQGVQGAQGISGVQGLQGIPGQNQITLAFGFSASNSVSPKNAVANCPTGMVVIGGFGGAIEGLGVPTTQKIAISYSGVPPLVSNYFRVDGFEAVDTSASWQIVAVAQCIPAN